MQVLITGGAGFIGSHLCEAFFNRGDDVTILDNISTGSKKNVYHLKGAVSIIEGDIRDKELVETLVSKSDLVLHMAAAVGVKTILESPVESMSTNFAGSEIVLNACVKYDKKILIASTSEIYGKNPKQPLSESDDRILGTPQKLRWSYADAKALEEAMAYALFLSKGLKLIIVRFFNVVGPRQSGAYGMVLPRFIGSALSEKTLEIYGDGNQTRVFCHILDAVDAVVKLTDSSNALGKVFNIGGIEEISIKKLAELVIEVLNSNSKVVFYPYNEIYGTGFEDMKRRVPDLTRIKESVTWEPKINLKDIIKDIAKSLN
jgi:UDP-glucose 4-epimerase